MLLAFDRGLATITETVRSMAASPHTQAPSERYLLFCYHTRFLNPARAFRVFLSNIRNFHHGVASYWEPVDWESIRVVQWMEM
jgi:hypothetical protein